MGGIQSIAPIPKILTSLASGPVSCPAGQETSLISVTLDSSLWVYLLSLAYSAPAGASGFVEFRMYLNGARVPSGAIPYATRKTQLGTIGAPQPYPKPPTLPNGGLFEIRVNSTDSVTRSCECDGEIGSYDKPIY